MRYKNNLLCDSCNVLVDFNANPHLDTLLASLEMLVYYCKIKKSKVNSLDSSQNYGKFYNKVLEAYYV